MEAADLMPTSNALVPIPGGATSIETRGRRQAPNAYVENAFPLPMATTSHTIYTKAFQEPAPLLNQEVTERWSDAYWLKAMNEPLVSGRTWLGEIFQAPHELSIKVVATTEGLSFVLPSELEADATDRHGVFFAGVRRPVIFSTRIRIGRSHLRRRNPRATLAPPPLSPDDDAG